MIGKTPLGALLAAGATLGLTTAAQAENWYAFYMVPMGVAYVDKDSIIYRPGHVSAKVQSTFPEPQHLARNGQVLTYSKSVDTIDIDCKALVYRNVARDLYTDAGQQQASVSEADDPRIIIARSPQDVPGQGLLSQQQEIGVVFARSPSGGFSASSPRRPGLPARSRPA